MEETKPVFDAAKPFVVPILSGGEKICEVKFPTDDQWCAWARAQRTVRRFLGRGKSQSEDLDLPKINAELFTKIRTDKDGPVFDDADAGMVIGRIERCAVANVEREGINYRIEMKVPGARVLHVLRMPTAKEMQDHERASTSVVAARRSIETRAFLEPSGALYDKLHIFARRLRWRRADRAQIGGGVRGDRATGHRGGRRPGIASPGDWPEEPGVRFLVRSVLHQGTLCGADEECPDRIFRCRKCGYLAQTELDGCPGCGADWRSIDVSHGPVCPKNRLEEAMDSPSGALVRRCFRILNAKSIGLTITLADVTEEEFRVLELIETERRGQRSDSESPNP